MSDDTKMTGGCMCGAVRYETTGESFKVIHCHCQSCRKHNGAPVVTLAGFNADQVKFIGDERKIYESSPGVGRAFCGKCGTPLTWEGDAGDRGPGTDRGISHQHVRHSGGSGADRPLFLPRTHPLVRHRRQPAAL